jgi:hypothetical protein
MEAEPKPVERELEELVLKESIVSATGISADALQVGIKGDPSLRETALQRAKYRSVIDEIYDDVRVRLEDLLLNRGTYRLYIGFNSGEIRTHSVFDPLREETHSAERFLDSSYLERHFPAISYEDKVAGMRDIYRTLRGSALFDKLPGYWRNIVEKRHINWKPMDREAIAPIMANLKNLRDMPDYYLRNVSICIVQGLVRMQFNCDGTQLVTAKNYRRFLEENFPV